MMRGLLLSKKIRVLLIVLAGILLGVKNAEGATYYSRSTGDWTNRNTWSLTSGGGRVGNGVFPKAGDNVYIENGYTVTVTANAACATLNIASGSQITVNANFTMTFTGAVSISGTWLNKSSGAISGGTITFNSGSTYQHALDGGTIPTATWNKNSTCLVTGVVGNFPTGMSQAFGNVTWNCPAQTVWGSQFVQTGLKILGNFTMQNTNNVDLGFCNTDYQNIDIGGDLIITGGTYRVSYNKNTIHNIAGNINISGGTLQMNSSDAGTASGTINLEGNLSITGGTVDLSKANVDASGIINIKGNFSQTAGSITETGAATNCQINFNGTSTQTYSKAGGTISNAINFAVNGGSTLDVGTSVINGSSGTFTLNPNAGIITAHAQGLSTTAGTGSIQVTGTKTYSTNANYTYNGSAAQVTGNGLSGAKNLTIDNSAGVNLSVATSVSGKLTLASGILTTTATNLLYVTNTLTSGISGGSTSAFISGPVKWSLASGSSYTFPVGKASTYLPFELNVTSGSSPQITVEAFTGNAGGNPTAPLYSLSNSEYWLASVVGGTYTNGSVSLTRQVALSGLNTIGISSTLAGNYVSLNGTESGTSILNSDNTGSSLGYFVMAGKCNSVNDIPGIASSPSPANGATDVCYAGVGAVTSVSWATLAKATSYDVYFGAGSLPGTATATVTGTSYSTGTLLPNTTYYWKVVPKNACGSASEAITWSFTTRGSTCASYCNSNFTDVGWEFVSNVTFAGINNNSAGTTGAPGNYTNLVAQVVQGSSYTISVTIDPDNNDYVYCFIDWNQNGTLNDAGEVYTIASNTSSAGPHTSNITVPSGATIGVTRMRIMVDWKNANPDPCRNATYGEAEDYTLNIIAPCTNGTITLSSAVGTNNQTVCNGTAIAPITYTIEGGATGATASGLPSGVTSSFVGGTLTISGTPTTSGNYTVTTTGTPGSCQEASASGSFTVNPLPNTGEIMPD